jgi:hypothetical protein
VFENVIKGLVIAPTDVILPLTYKEPPKYRSFATLAPPLTVKHPPLVLETEFSVDETATPPDTIRAPVVLFDERVVVFI